MTEIEKQNSHSNNKLHFQSATLSKTTASYHLGLADIGTHSLPHPGTKPPVTPPR